MMKRMMVCLPNQKKGREELSSDRYLFQKISDIFYKYLLIFFSLPAEKRSQLEEYHFLEKTSCPKKTLRQKRYQMILDCMGSIAIIQMSPYIHLYTVIYINHDNYNNLPLNFFLPFFIFLISLLFYMLAN